MLRQNLFPLFFVSVPFCYDLNSICCCDYISVGSAGETQGRRLPIMTRAAQSLTALLLSLSLGLQAYVYSVMYKHAHCRLVRELYKYGCVCGIQLCNLHIWVAGIYDVLPSATFSTATPTLDRKIMSDSGIKLCCTLGFNERQRISWPDERSSPSQLFDVHRGLAGIAFCS